eukprot:XP_017952152.1 PREDICTED: bone morphogenetic protein 15 isoform X3 [Xenopus tropicalis]
MKPASHHHSLPLLLLFLLSATSVGNEFRALARSPSLPLIKTLLDHGPLKPSMAAKHELSLQHLRFMLDLYRRSADGDGRPRTGHQAGAAVRLEITGTRRLSCSTFMGWCNHSHPPQTLALRMK